MVLAFCNSSDLSQVQFTAASFFKGWRCKRYGHRTGDKECPFFIKGNQKLEQFRVVSTDIVVLLLVFLILIMHNLASEEKPVR